MRDGSHECWEQNAYPDDEDNYSVDKNDDVKVTDKDGNVTIKNTMSIQK